MYGQDYDKLFNITKVSSDLPGLHKSALFRADNNQLQQVYKNKSKELRLAIPYGQESIFNVILKQKQIFSQDYALSQKSGSTVTNAVQIQSGRYYTGKVEGAESSLVSLSIYKDRIAGTIRYKEKTYNIGLYPKSNYHIIYEASDLVEDLSFECESIEHEPFIAREIHKTGTSCASAINIYFECDYDMYQNFNSNLGNVQDYVADIFNEISTLYDNENIPVLISQIVVWTSPDPYTNNSSGLYDFRDDLVTNGYNGDVAQLLTNDSGANGGIAYVDQLCGSFPFAYADINNSYNPYPTYSWDVQVVTHELGHVLGARHTHQCVWGPNNDQQIDDCGNVAAGSGGSCYNPSSPIVPSAGGTIMSYCHTQSVGINFVEGFGTEPGDLIRQRHASCMCDNATCEDATLITSNGTYFAQPNNGNGATSNSAAHADWFTFVPDSNGVVTVKSCGQGIDTRLWLRSGTCSNLINEAYSDDNCDTGNGSNYASEIDTYDVSAGTTYFIEWDNRWSSSSFNWDFIFVADTTPILTIICPQDYVGNNLCNSNSHLPVITGSAISNDTSATITYTDDIVPTNCMETISRTWLVTDSNASTTSCAQSIQITDNDPPIISNCPTDLTVTSDSTCVYLYAVTDPIASDNCDLSLDIVWNVQQGDPLQIGTTLITYQYTDDCNNSSSCNFNLTVLDGCIVMPPCTGTYVDINGTVMDSLYHAKMDVNANAMLMSGESTTFKAGQEINLNAGFEIQAGATIEIMIEDCENN
ncbi:M57 family metalloprotease [Saprospiraceae bacterium]|nr:M57 family metalloprotease [Saprospiraceae bacterium]